MPAPAPIGTAPAMPSEMPKLELPKAEAPEPSTLQLPQPEASAPQAQQPEPAKVEAKAVADPRVAFVAFTGSVEGGRAVHEAAASRFVACGLELGGNG